METRRLPSWMIGGAVVNDQKKKKEAKETRSKAKAESDRVVIKREVRRRPKRRVKAESSSSVNDEETALVDGGGDDVELTVDDLVRFAHEYARADEGAKRKQTLNIEKKSERERSTQADRNTVSPVKSISEQSAPMMGDPAQDMLNLLLGPLLSKPPSEDKGKDTRSVLTGMDFSIGLETHRQSEVREEKHLLVNKKKSSLKDEVSSFVERNILDEL